MLNKVKFRSMNFSEIKFHNAGKQYIAITAVIIIAIISVFAVNILSQDYDTKVDVFNKSLSYEKENNYKKALEPLTSSYEANKNDYLFNMRLGWLYYLNKDYTNSIKYYNIAKNLEQFSIEPLLGLTLPYAAQEKWSEVKVQYENVLRMDKNNYTANLRLGQIYLSNKDYQNAKKYLETVHTSYPGEYEPNLSLGWTYYYFGDKVKAKELLTNALMLSPNDKLAKEGLDLIK
ncbi:MAG: hypothetical protein A2V93_00845 [Ignavibacteria bacterium RBG_16_34_14]|nr:MAG: hypothetical protein A2V93_00845 [Ignavibacteria bacterium RBG_16_34_14]